MNIMIRDPTVLLYEFRFEQHGCAGWSDGVRSPDDIRSSPGSTTPSAFHHAESDWALPICVMSSLTDNGFTRYSASAFSPGRRTGELG